MSRKAVTACLSTIAAALGGCATSPPTATDVVPIHEVIDSLKCASAVALVAATPRTGLRGSKAAIELQLNVVSDTTSGLDVQTNPAIVLYTGATIAPYLKASYERKYTVNTTVKFDLDMQARDSSICGTDNEKMADVDIGFGRWILGVVSEIDKARAGAPLATVTNYTYDASFALTRKDTAGIKLTVVPIVADMSQATQRDDVQHLKIEITPAKGGGATMWKVPFFLPAKPALNERAARVYRQIAPTR